MEKSVKMVSSWDVMIHEDPTVNFNVYELTVFQLWLIAANKNPDIKPLFLKGVRFAWREESFILFFCNTRGINRSRCIDIINAIYNLTHTEFSAIHMLGTHYPKADSWHGDFDKVDVKETLTGSFIGFWREDTRQSILPVQLRWSGDMGTWYGVKGVPYHGVEFQFKDLTFGQI